MNNFGDIPAMYTGIDNAQIVILPVPYDGTSTWIKGAGTGPKALLEASTNMELYDIETDYEVYKNGIHTANPIKEKNSPEKMTEAVYNTTKSFLSKNKFVVTIGGEHSVSIGTINAHAEKYPGMCILQIDAHADLRDSYKGSKYNHACVMARAKEVGPIVQVGIRSMDIQEKNPMQTGKVFFAHEIHADKNWITKVIESLRNDVYITIDLDGFDPSILPSTGTPEPGGLQWYETLQLLKQINESKNIIGFDVVELCPNKKEKSSNFLAAKLVYKLLSYRFNKQSNE